MAELGRLDDESLVQFVAVFHRALEQVDVPTCASVWTPTGGVDGAGIGRLALRADSSVADQWTRLEVRLVDAWVRGRATGGERADASEVATRVAAARAALPAADQERFARVWRDPGATPADRCFTMRTIFRGYERLPREPAGRVLRVVFGG